MTLISHINDKWLDYSVFSKYCRGFKLWENRKNEPGYNDWLLNHVCQSNHNQSSGAMEPAGVLEMFK